MKGVAKFKIIKCCITGINDSMTIFLSPKLVFDGQDMKTKLKFTIWEEVRVFPNL